MRWVHPINVSIHNLCISLSTDIWSGWRSTWRIWKRSTWGPRACSPRVQLPWPTQWYRGHSLQSIRQWKKCSCASPNHQVNCEFHTVTFEASKKVERSCIIPNLLYTFQVALLDCTDSSGHIRDGITQPPHWPCFMKRPSKWSTSSMIQTSQGWGAGEGCGQEGISAHPHCCQELHKSIHPKDKDRVYSLVPVLPFLWMSRWMCSGQKLWAKPLKLTSLDAYKVESQEASSTL